MPGPIKRAIAKVGKLLPARSRLAMATLSTRLTAAMLLMVVITAAAIEVVTYRGIESALLPGVRTQIDTQVRLFAADLDSYIGIARADIFNIRAAASLEGLMRARPDGGADPNDETGRAVWQARLAKVYATVLAAKPYYRQFRLIGIDDGGKELVRVDRSGPDSSIRIVAEPDLQKKGTAAYMIATAALPEGEVYVSPIGFNSEYGKLELPLTPVARVATPVVRDDGTLFGILVINLDVRDSFNRMRSANKFGGSLFVVNENGDYLLHPDPGHEFGFEYGKRYRIQDDYPALAALLKSEGPWQDVITDQTGESLVSAAARLKLGANESIAVVKIVPEAAITAPVRTLAYSGLLAGLAVAIGALVFAVLIARSLTRPLRQLTAAVQAFGRDEPMALPTHAAGEIGVLVREFGLLVDGIKSRSMAIDRYAKRESLYAAAVHSASLAFLTTDSDAIITAWNPGAERLFGYLADEVIGRDVEMLIPAERRGDIADIRGKCKDGEWIKNYATMRVGKSGKPIDVVIDISPLRSPTGQLVGSTAIIRDITEQRLAEELFRIAVEGSPSGMLMIDRVGKIVMVNGEIEKLFGYQRDELLGQGIEILVPHNLRADHMKLREQFIKREIGGPVVRGRHLSGMRKDGSEFYAEVELNAVHARDGIVVLANIIDVSERRRAEMIKQEFVSTVSHELRTPMTSVTASLALLSSGSAGPLSAAAVRLLTIAHANSQRLARLVNDILDIEKYDSGKMVFTFGPVNTRALVEQAIEINRAYADEFGVTVRLRSGSGASAVRADADRLAQVIANLLSNAIKFSPRGEEVAVEIAEEGDTIRISVRDYGPGIPDDFKPHIFERFAQADAGDARKKGGSGLGLSIVKKIIDGLGGQIGFEGARGGGTMFFVTIPRWDAGAGSRLGKAGHDMESREVA